MLELVTATADDLSEQSFYAYDDQQRLLLLPPLRVDWGCPHANPDRERFTRSQQDTDENNAGGPRLPHPRRYPNVMFLVGGGPHPLISSAFIRPPGRRMPGSVLAWTAATAASRTTSANGHAGLFSAHGVARGWRFALNRLDVVAGSACGTNGLFWSGQPA